MEEAEAIVAKKAEAPVTEVVEVEEEETDVTVDDIDSQLQPFNHPKEEAEEAEATMTEVAEVTVVEEEKADVTWDDIDLQLQPFNHPEVEEVEAKATEHPPVYWDLGVGIPGYVLWTKLKVTHLEGR